ncbi:hypothetical protein AbraIFM66951_004880 [Aspergillus brasiliensis]|nr:hypothetical protein AbraIFM66951_004880 [Aspergillus brasiliensis]
MGNSVEVSSISRRRSSRMDAILSEMRPFGARFRSELWTCRSNVSFSTLDPVLYVNRRLQGSPGTTDYIRFVLNKAPLPLCALVGCKDAVNGVCPVEDFLADVPTLKENGQYQKACFGD